MAWHLDQVILIFEVGVRRPFVSLAAKENVDGRLELLWGSWARFLVGFSVSNTTFVLSTYLFFSEGRVFLSSTTTGVVSILNTVEMAALGYLAFHRSMRLRLQTWLCQFGTVVDAMAVSTLMSQGGDKPLDEVMTTAKEKLRYVTLSSMDISDFNSVSRGARSRSKYEMSVHCAPRDSLI